MHTQTFQAKKMSHLLFYLRPTNKSKILADLNISHDHIKKRMNFSGFSTLRCSAFRTTVTSFRPGGKGIFPHCDSESM